MTVQSQFEAAVDLHRKGQFAEAERLYHDILCREPEHLAALSNLAAAASAQGRFADAEALYERLVELQPDSPDVANDLGIAQAMRDRLDAAADSFNRALSLDPANLQAMNNLGSVLVRRGRFDEAAEIYRQALLGSPDFVDAHDNLGAALQALGDFEAAAASHREALRLDPGRLLALCNLGNALRGAGRFEAALSHYDQALEREPGWPLAEWHRALALLLQGDFEAGWPAYEARFAAGISRLPDMPWARWEGVPLSGKTLLVYGEQGIGDEVMFASCLPDVMERADRCVVVCEPRLAPIFNRSFPAAEIHGTRHGKPTDIAGLAAVDYWVPAASLPRFWRPDEAAFPGRESYLAADPALVRRWRDRLVSLGGERTVGISWQGGRAGVERSRRSAPLELWRSLATIPGVRLVSLQYGDYAKQLGHARREWGLEIALWDDMDPLRDLDDLAGLIAALDYVVSIDNATVHLAGSLGRPVWALLPIPPDWRWMTARSDSPWYPTMTLVRQERPGDWKGVFDRVVRQLRERIAAGA